MSDKKQTSAIIIPALDPDEELFGYVESLIEAGFDKVILVDDGSDAEHRKVFDRLETLKECFVLRHAINLGKGRGLKNAFNFFLNLPDVSDYCGVITADADGQHKCEDIIRIADKLEENSKNGMNSLILGVRDFNLDNVPWKSRFGNKSTITVFRLLHGVKLKDTQTGLRGIPTGIIPDYLELFGERFEYETNMLIVAARSESGIEEIAIETIYENENAGTHFNPIKDSWAIYKLLFGTFFRYVISALSSFVVDILLFKLALVLLKKGDFDRIDASDIIVISTVAARIFSSLYNYAVNKNYVFENRKKGLSFIVKYYILAALQLLCSAYGVAWLFGITGLPEVLVKCVVDAVLFIISFQIQKRIIFK